MCPKKGRASVHPSDPFPSGGGTARFQVQLPGLGGRGDESSREVIEAAYARSDLFERRRILMGDWSRYLAQGTAKDSKS